MTGSPGSVIKGVLLGAGLMYFFDPDRGRRRRAGALDRARRLGRETGDIWNKGYRDLRNRSAGLAAETRRAVSQELIEDHRLAERVRAALGHCISDAKGVHVAARYGTVTLSGTVRPGEPETLIAAIEDVPGVLAVESSLVTAGEPVAPRPVPSSLTPAGRMLLTAGGGMLVLNGLVRRGFAPSFLGVAGAGMLLKSLTDATDGPLVGRGVAARASIHIHAPVEKVFDFVSDIDQVRACLPRALRIEPRGRDRMSWQIEGPAPLGRIEGEVRVAELVENRRIVWENSKESPVVFHKDIRFHADGDEYTTVDVSVIYEPPGGLLGHIAATVFGFGPRGQLHRSLNRIKHHLEAGSLPPGAAEEVVREHRG